MIDLTTLPFGNYSTSEVNTGFTWVNGKPVYKRTITGNVTASAGTRDVTVRSDITGIEAVVDASGYFQYSTGNTFPYGGTQTDSTGGTVSKAIGLLVSSASISVLTISDVARTSQPYYLTLFYTKT